MGHIFNILLVYYLCVPKSVATNYMCLRMRENTEYKVPTALESN